MKTCTECRKPYEKWRNDIFPSRCHPCQKEIDRTNPLDYIDDVIMDGEPDKAREWDNDNDRSA